jgi:hypothetical protein
MQYVLKNICKIYKIYVYIKRSTCLYPNTSLDPLAFICGVNPLAAVFQVIHRVAHSVVC